MVPPLAGDFHVRKLPPRIVRPVLTAPQDFVFTVLKQGLCVRVVV